MERLNIAPVLPIAGRRIEQIKACFQKSHERFRDNPIALQCLELYRACTIDQIGDEDLIDSCRPYAHIYHSDTLGFLVRVDCYGYPVSGWAVGDVPRTTTLRRLVINGKVPRIPWARIKDGDTWYGKIDLNSRYWQLVERDLLNKFEVGTDAAERRGERVEDLLRPYRRSSKGRNLREQIDREFAQKLENPLEDQSASQSYLPNVEPDFERIKELIRAHVAARFSGRGSGALEARALEDYTRPLRKCHVQISAGPMDGLQGYFTRYSRDGQDLIITFAKKNRRDKVKSFLETTPPISWITLDSGGTFEFDSHLRDYMLTRITDGCTRTTVVYCNLTLLEPLGFFDCLKEVSEQFGFSL